MTGLTISKSSLLLNEDHLAELSINNISIHEDKDKYILYYRLSPQCSDAETLCLFKGLLTRIRTDEIYNAYNNDFRVLGHNVRPIVKIKLKHY